MKKIILFLIITLLSAEPRWYGKAKLEDGYLYGSGQSDSKETSKQKALADLRNSISVSVSSQISSQKERVNHKIYSKDSQEIHLNSNVLELDNVEIVKQEVQKGVYYTMVRINRDLFLQGLVKKYNMLYAKFAPLIPKGCGIFLQQFSGLKELLDQIEPIERILRAYGVINKPLDRYEDIYHKNLPKPKVILIFDSNADLEIKQSLISAYARVLQPSKEQGLYKIANHIFTEEKEGKTRIKVNFSVSNCEGETILDRNIVAYETDRDFALLRIQSLLYKQLKGFANKEGQGNTGL
ncbi:LPP20 family lipoprotein [Helicobacter cetorum]|uniref:LPP20 family lipoprotein n=1 Tax=Helicobacter cetorum TaxID=138563 RepID=UPI000CF0D971|nr:LPP20 family lipoprotein [Helicobacter cetorum]